MVGNAHIATFSKTNSRLSSRVVFRHNPIVQALTLITKGGKQMTSNSIVEVISIRVVHIISNLNIILLRIHSNSSASPHNMLIHMATSNNRTKDTLLPK